MKCPKRLTFRKAPVVGGDSVRFAAKEGATWDTTNLEAENLKFLLFEADTRLPEQGSARWFALSRDLDRTQPLRDWADRVLKLAGYRHSAVLAHAGTGKTWSLARLAQKLAAGLPVFFISARDQVWRKASGILDAMAEVASRVLAGEAITREKLLRLLESSLVGDEQVTVIIDGIDASTDTQAARAQLLTLGMQAGPLPVRTIASCRTTCWSWFRSCYEGKLETHVVSTALADFTDAELARAEKALEPLLIDENLQACNMLRHPTVYGLARDLATRGASLDCVRRGTSLFEVLERYIEEIVDDTFERSRAPAWWIEWALGTAAELVFSGREGQPQRSEASGVARALFREELEHETAEYHAGAVEALCEARVFIASPTHLAFEKELVAEYLVAHRVLWRMREGDLSHLKDLAARPGPNPTDMVATLAFVGARLARRGIEIWKEEGFDFEGREDWIAQMAYLLGPAETSESLVRALLENNIRRISHFMAALPGVNPALLDSATDLGDPETFLAYEKTAADAGGPTDGLEIAAIPARSLTFRNLDESWSRGDLPDEVKPDFDFWFLDLPERLIPRLAEPSMPAKARVLLVRTCLRLCAERRFPAELTAAVYLPFAKSLLASGGHLPEEGRLRILFCEDNEIIASLYDRCIEQGFEPIRELILTRFTSDGNEAIQSLTEQRWSLFLTDVVHPGPSGPDIVRWFRAHGRCDWNANTLIVWLTGYPYGASRVDQDEEEGNASPWDGGDGHLPKPFRPEELQLVILGYGPRDRYHLRAIESEFMAIIARQKVEHAPTKD